MRCAARGPYSPQASTVWVSLFSAMFRSSLFGGLPSMLPSLSRSKTEKRTEKADRKGVRMIFLFLSVGGRGGGA